MERLSRFTIPKDGRLSLIGNPNALDAATRVAKRFELFYRFVDAGFDRGNNLKRVVLVPPTGNSQLVVLWISAEDPKKRAKCGSYPGLGYICVNSTWCEATGSPSRLKIRNLELVVPWSIEPTKISSVGGIVC